jgi:hypothetical protein
MTADVRIRVMMRSSASMVCTPVDDETGVAVSQQDWPIGMTDRDATHPVVFDYLREVLG